MCDGIPLAPPNAPFSGSISGRTLPVIGNALPER
jgi:hypothetical protein